MAFVKHVEPRRYAVVVAAGDTSRHEVCAWHAETREYDLIVNYYDQTASVEERYVRRRTRHHCTGF